MACPGKQWSPHLCRCLGDTYDIKGLGVAVDFIGQADGGIG